MKKIHTQIFFLIIAVLNILYFWRVFTIGFFKDDFFFYSISRIDSLSDFLHFFSPIRTYSYKPLASEVFYFLINRNIIFGHLIVFVTFFIGLFYLYKSIILISKNTYLAQLTILIYSLSSVHVFQLYWLATYQEILVFTALSVSFYYFLHKKQLLSLVFYVCALLSKETAILYVVFLFLFQLITQITKKQNYKVHLIELLKNIYIYGLLSLLFYLIYQYSLHYVTSIDNYRMDFNFKRILNNALWYFLWGWGVPSFLSDYMTSIFSKPIIEFGKIWNEPYVNLYFSLFGIYICTFITTIILFIACNIDKVKKNFIAYLVSILCFFIFLGPVLFFPHRWMVRLTLPLIFISLFQSYILTQFFSSTKPFKFAAVLLVGLYLVMNFFGVKLHENASTYILESSISKRAEIVFNNKSRFAQCSSIYIKDPKNMLMSSWDGSEKIALTFFGEEALAYYFPKQTDLTIVYQYQSKDQPYRSCTVNSDELIQ